MKHIKKKQWIIMGAVIILLIGLTIGGVFYFQKTEEEPISEKKEENQMVSPDEAITMYENFTKECDGVYTWNLKEGDTLTIKNIEDQGICQKENYYSKMIGYTYDLEDNVIIHANVLKKKENKLYKLNDIYVNEYDENNINNLLDQGTTYAYTYKKNGDQYILTKVEIMS